MPSKRVLIVGGVAGGASCAARLRRLDEQAEIVIFERTGHVSFANCGLPYYLGNVISDRQQLLLATPQRFQALFRIDVRVQHEVLSIDRAEKCVKVKNRVSNEIVSEPYDYLVLAPGSAPIRPSFPGVELPGIFTLRNLEDTDRIQTWLTERSATRAVVVGAGYIGLEMTENLCRRGLHVTLLEKLDQIMPPADAEMTVPLRQTLRKHGVDLHLNCAVTGFEQNEQGGLTVLTEQGDRFPADLVLLALGVKPEVHLARDAGLEIGSLGGIRVDEHLRTKDPAVYAVGDAIEVVDFVTRRPTLLPLAGPANRQGRLVADALCGRDVHYRGSQGTAIVGLFDMVLATTGASEKSLIRANIPFEKIYLHTPHHAGYYPGAERISLKVLFSPETGRLLGAQAVGKEGVDKRIDVLALAIQKEATVYDLEESELCYAPPFGSAKDPVNFAGFVAGNILRGDVSNAQWSEWRKLAAEGRTPITLDVRPSSLVVAESIPGTIRIPLAELRARLHELPRDREIWVHCVVGQTSYNATRILKQHGFKVRNLSGGFTSFKMEEEAHRSE